MSDPSLLNWTYLVLLEDPWLNFCFIYTLRHYQFWCKNFRNVKSPYIFLLFLEFKIQKMYPITLITRVWILRSKHFWFLVLEPRNHIFAASMCEGTEKTIWHATTIILTLNQISEVKTSWHFAPKKKYFATLTTMAEKNLSSLDLNSFRLYFL